MLKKTIKYTDFNGKEASEDFYFNLTKAEVAEMELSLATIDSEGNSSGGMVTMLNDVVSSGSGKRIIEVFKEILAKSYGIRSEDGKRFIKSDKAFEEFMQTAAYSEFFMELITEAGVAADFIKGVLPADLNTDSDKPVVPQFASLETPTVTNTPENY